MTTMTKTMMMMMIVLLMCIESNTRACGDMEFIFECSNRYRTSECSKQVRYDLNTG